MTASTNGWVQIPSNFHRFIRCIRPRHIYSTPLLFFEIYICILFGFLRTAFTSHNSRQHYPVLKIFAAGAQNLSTSLRFQIDIDQLEAYNTWLFVMIVTSWVNFLSALLVIIIGFCVPCLNLLFRKIKNCRKKMHQKVKYASDGVHLLQVAETCDLHGNNERKVAHDNQGTRSDNFSKNTVENHDNTLKDSRPITDEEERNYFLVQQFYNLTLGSKFNELFYFLVFLLQTVVLLLFLLAFLHLISTVSGKLAGEILAFIENTAERNPDGFLIVQTVFECCGFAMKAGGINYGNGECQSADETVNCTQKITGDIVSLMQLVLCAAFFTLICVLYIIVIYKCRDNIRNEKKKTLAKTNDILIAPQLQEIPDAAVSNRTETSDAAPVVVPKSDPHLIVSAIIHNVKGSPNRTSCYYDTKENIEYEI